MQKIKISETLIPPFRRAHLEAAFKRQQEIDQLDADMEHACAVNCVEVRIVESGGLRRLELLFILCPMASMKGGGILPPPRFHRQ